MSRYGQHVRPRNWNWQRLHLSLRTLTAVSAGCCIVVACLALVVDARRDLAAAERRMAAVEAEAERVTQDLEYLWQNVIGDPDPLDPQRSTLPGPAFTAYEAPEPERTMPLPSPNRSRPRRTVSPSPAPSWHPVTPSRRAAMQQQPTSPEPSADPSTSPSAPPSPTPAPTESSTTCPAATVGDVIPCVLESLPLSPIGATP